MGKLNVQCFTCAHNDVCKLNNQYAAAIKTLEEVSFDFAENERGEIATARIRETKWLDMELKCKHAMSVAGGGGNE